MLQFYKEVHSIVDRDTGDVLDHYSAWDYICDEEKPKDKCLILTWDNIEESLEKIKKAHIMHDPLLSKHRKGFLFIVGTWWNKTYRFKQWKRPELNLEYDIEYMPVNMSIKDILNYDNSDLAIQYLLERGIKYVGK